uniref:Uncharacterized protein n=1 Tax=Callorhinchus milii TaxID=7868 RepID=A0A4W3GRA2_CALMI
ESQEEFQHGRWTVSSSDEEEPEGPGNRPDSQTEAPAAGGADPGSDDPREPPETAPVRPPEAGILPRGTAWRRGTSSPGNKRTSPAVKRGRPSPSELGWDLSSSDSEPDAGGGGERDTSTETTWDTTGESSETPDEQPDKWDLLEKCKTFRFFLTRVSGISTKYNSEALHIKGE